MPCLLGVLSSDVERRTSAASPAGVSRFINVPSPSTTSAVCGRLGDGTAEGVRETGALGVCGMGGKVTSILVGSESKRAAINH